MWNEDSMCYHMLYGLSTYALLVGVKTPHSILNVGNLV